MPIDSSVDVATLLNFTEADLAQNRIGQLSDRQEKAVKRKYRTQSLVGGFVALCFAGTGIFVLVTDQAYFCGIPILLIGAFVAYLVISLNTVSVDELHVQQVTGYLERHIHSDSDSTSYYFIINDIRMRVSKKVYNAFPDDEAFTFYYVKRQVKNISEAPSPISFETADDVPQHPEKKKKAE
ncbi:MAG: hypothetical protein AAF126_09630 [Chloroflexota bacterium]